MRDSVTGGVRRDSESRVFAYPSTLLLCAVWVFVGTLAYGRQFLHQPGRAIDMSLVPEYFIWLTCFLPWVPLSHVVFRAERRFSLGQAGWLRNLAVLAAISLPVSYSAFLLSLLLGAGVTMLFGRAASFAPESATISLGGWLIGGFLYWSTVAASWALRVLLEARESERRTAQLMLEKSQLQNSLRQAELDALRMRLDPHFLFNCLQNISVLVQHDPRTGARMLTRLGDLLRVSLRRDGKPETTLQAEVELTRSYLAIEQMRFGDRLSSVVNLAEGTEYAMVPTFLLQPLVENAIRHGLKDTRKGGLITITSGIEGDRLILTVTDNGAGPPHDAMSEAKVGIGLGATCERLERMYPGQHEFTMLPMIEGGTEVRMKLPLKVEAPKEALADASAAAAHR